MKFTVYEEKVTGPVMEFEAPSRAKARKKVVTKYPDDTKTRFVVCAEFGFDVFAVQNKAK